MPTHLELKIARELQGAIDREGMGSDRERIARSLVPVFGRTVRKLIEEEVRAAIPKPKA